MGFIKGKAFPIVNTMAKKGVMKAKNLFLAAPNMPQEQVDNIVQELLSIHAEKKPIKEEDELKLVKKEEEKAPKEKEEKEEEVEEIEGDLLQELEVFIREEKKLLKKYKENVFASQLKPIITAKEAFIERLEKVGEKDE